VFKKTFVFRPAIAAILKHKFTAFYSKIKYMFHNVTDKECIYSCPYIATGYKLIFLHDKFFRNAPYTLAL